MVLLPELRFVGATLQRPECVLAHESGYLVTSDVSGSGGIAVIAPDGTTRKVAARNPPEPLRPNGVALLSGGATLLAHLGADHGGVFRLEPDGRVEPMVTEVAGTRLPPTNFVVQDARGRTWVTVSTRKRPRQLDYRPDAKDGFIVLADERGARIVADGLGYTNECAFHPDGERLFVNETFARRTSAFTVRPDGSLVDRHVVARYGPGTFPDGLAFAEDGALWITSIVSNRIIRVDADGTQELIVEDADDTRLVEVESSFRAATMGAEHLEEREPRTLRHISSLAFGGPNLRTAYLGSLMSDRIASFDVPVAGHPPPHWRHDIDTLIHPDPGSCN